MVLIYWQVKSVCSLVSAKIKGGVNFFLASDKVSYGVPKMCTIHSKHQELVII